MYHTPFKNTCLKIFAFKIYMETPSCYNPFGYRFIGSELMLELSTLLDLMSSYFLNCWHTVNTLGTPWLPTQKQLKQLCCNFCYLIAECLNWSTKSSPVKPIWAKTVDCTRSCKIHHHTIQDRSKLHKMVGGSVYLIPMPYTYIWRFYCKPT